VPNWQHNDIGAVKEVKEVSMCRKACTLTVQAMLFIAYIEGIAQFVLSRSFKQCFANASVAQWAALRIGHTRLLVRFPVLFIFFHFFLQQNYLCIMILPLIQFLLQNNNHIMLLQLIQCAIVLEACACAVPVQACLHIVFSFN